jgi:hypothetical protein
MSREHRGMKIVEARMSKMERNRRRKALARRFPVRSTRLKVLLAAGSLIRDMARMCEEGVTFSAVLKALSEIVTASLVKEGYKGKETPDDPAFAERQKKMDIARAAMVKAVKANIVKCSGKAAGKCQNPKCRKTTLKKWKGALGKSYLLCSRCGWTNRPVC